MGGSLGTVDLTIVGLYLAATFGVGFWASRGNRKLSDYLLGNRNMPWWAVLFSIVATESSIVTFLSVPGTVSKIEGVPNTGTMAFLQLPLGYVLGRYLVVALLLPAYFRGELFSAYQILGERFGGNTKRVASLIFIVARTVADGLRLYLAAMLLQQAFDADLRSTIVVVGAATLIYTYFGGVKAVIWTEVAQFAIKVIGTLVAGIVVYQAAGGWNEVMAFGHSSGASRVFDFEFSLTRPYTFWAGLVGGAFLSLASHGVDQMMVQRYLCAGNLRSASRALALSGWVVLVLFTMVLMVGLGLAAYYAKFPPAEPFTKTDQIFKTFVLNRDLMPIGLIGLIVAAVLSAAMSTLSSSLNSAAGSLVSDWLQPAFGWSSENRASLVATKALTLVFGVLQILMAIRGEATTGAVVDQVLKIASITSGILLGLFFLGSFTKARESAALLALIITASVIGYMAFYSPLAMPWFAVVSSIGLLMLGVVFEALFAALSRKP
ncbi:MAG TPA: sodium/solute symporter [Planctomycetia bacterium]|nr:sodium/solute symporter [Planctomycetia bacterium]